MWGCLVAKVYKFSSTDFDQGLFAGCACAFGVFDGFHVGHQFLVSSMIDRARRDGVRSLILTFDCDPDELFHPESLRKIMTDEERLSMLASSGVDLVVSLPFDRAFAALSPQEFLSQTFGDCAPSSLHVGCDFRFGVRASGNVETLRDWARSSNTDIVPYELQLRDGAPISASRIRALLADSRIKEANELLGRRYRVSGTIVSGRRQGRDMGFATANVSIPALRQTLGEGVYAAYGSLEGERYKAAVSMGASPTFEEAESVCEAHLLDFDRDVYGSELTLEFVEFLRPMKKFDSVEDLIKEVMANIQWCRDNL